MWDFGVFSNDYFPSPVCCHFFRTASFSEKLLLHTSSEWLLRTIVTFSEQLFLQSLCFFWGASFPEQSLLCSSYFFRKATLFCTFTKFYHFLIIGSFLGQLLFGTATILAKELFRINISTEEHSINFFRRAAFWKKSQFFSKGIFCITLVLAAIFSEELLFRNIKLLFE